MISTMLIPLLVMLVVFAIVWWVLQRLSLPEPVRMVAIAVMAIVAIIMLLNLAGM